MMLLVRTVALLALLGANLARAQQTPSATPNQANARPAMKPQPRPNGQRVKVDPKLVTVDDGDTVSIHWGENDDEIVRILGIDSPETRHDEHNIPMDQAFGLEARAFAMGAFSAATEVELLRCSTLDPYARTLGYLFINGKNYSLMIVNAHLAEESVTRYGDNGLPAEASEVLKAARAAGPTPFEPPGLFRNRMRELTTFRKLGTPAPK